MTIKLLKTNIAILFFSFFLIFPSISYAGGLGSIIKEVVKVVTGGAIGGGVSAAVESEIEESKNESSDETTKDNQDDTTEVKNEESEYVKYDRAKQENVEAAVTSVAEYYYYIEKKNIEGVKVKWLDPTSPKAMKALRIARNGGGKCQLYDGDLNSYSETNMSIKYLVACDEGRSRGVRYYTVKFDMKKSGNSWLIKDFNSLD